MEQRPGPLEGGRVPGVLVVVPHVLDEPRAAQRPCRPGRVPVALPRRQRERPRVRVVVRGPAAGAVQLTGGCGPRGGDPRQPGQQRLGALGEVRGPGGPVRHLQVDVGGVRGAPRRAHILVPDALQGQGHRPGPGARDHQVAPVLEQQRGEGGIPSHDGVPRDTRVRGQRVMAQVPAQVQGDPVEQRRVVGDMLGAQRLDRPLGSRRDGAPGPTEQLPDIPVRRAHRPGVVRDRGEHHRHLPGAVDGQAVVPHPQRAVRDHPHHHGGRDRGARAVVVHHRLRGVLVRRVDVRGHAHRPGP